MEKENQFKSQIKLEQKYFNGIEEKEFDRLKETCKNGEQKVLALLESSKFFKELKNPKKLKKNISKAINFIAKTHIKIENGQIKPVMRADEITFYVEHPIEVAKKAIELCNDLEENIFDKEELPDIIIASLLHDSIEDGLFTNGKKVVKEDLEKKFGKGVANLVLGVTKQDKIEWLAKKEVDKMIEENPDLKNSNYDDLIKNKKDYLKTEKKENGLLNYADQLEQLELENKQNFCATVAKDPRVAIIKLADSWHNIETIEAFNNAEKEYENIMEYLQFNVITGDLLGTLGCSKCREVAVFAMQELGKLIRENEEELSDDLIKNSFEGARKLLDYRAAIGVEKVTQKYQTKRERKDYIKELFAELSQQNSLNKISKKLLGELARLKGGVKLEKIIVLGVTGAIIGAVIIAKGGSFIKNLLWGSPDKTKNQQKPDELRAVNQEG